MNLAEIVRGCVPFLRSCYSCEVEIVNYPSHGFQQIGASGPYPHCGNKSYFKPVTGAYLEMQGATQIACNAAQCEACKNFGLVVGRRSLVHGANTPYLLEAFHPLGRPNDSVDAA